MANVGIDIKGLRETQAKMEQVARDIQGVPIVSAVAKATLLIERAAKHNAPVDRGALRASITPDVIVTSNRVLGIVGSNLKYAPYQELGTRPHWIPWEPIYAWARRKMKGNVKAAGALAATARKAIHIRGNVALHFLQNALESNIDRIRQLIDRAVSEVVNK